MLLKLETLDEIRCMYKNSFIDTQFLEDKIEYIKSLEKKIFSRKYGDIDIPSLYFHEDKELSEYIFNVFKSEFSFFIVNFEEELGYSIFSKPIETKDELLMITFWILKHAFTKFDILKNEMDFLYQEEINMPIESIVSKYIDKLDLKIDFFEKYLNNENVNCIQMMEYQTVLEKINEWEYLYNYINPILINMKNKSLL